MRNYGSVAQEQEEIEEIALGFYEELFTASSPSQP